MQNRLLKFIAFLTVALLIGVGSVYAASINFNSTSSGLVMNAGASVSYGAAGGSIVGYSSHPSTSAAQFPGCGANAAYYAQLLASGATWQRFDVGWQNIQSTSSASYIWGGLDCAVNDASALGINNLLIVDFSPQWAAHSGCTVNSPGQCAPASSVTFATFCTALAQHYPNQLYYEIWNEPNLSFFWGPAANADDYTTMEKACYSAIKIITPGAFILAGAVSRGGNIVPTTFINTMYSDSATFDGISMHPYAFPFSLASANSGNGWPDVATIRSTMVSHGDTAKPIWVTEFGAPTCGPGIGYAIDPASYVNGQDYSTLGAQTDLANQLIAALKVQTYVSKVFWYTLIDSNSNNNTTPENCFGSLFSSGNAKPAWSSLRSN